MSITNCIQHYLYCHYYHIIQYYHIISVAKYIQYYPTARIGIHLEFNSQRSPLTRDAAHPPQVLMKVTW